MHGSSRERSEWRGKNRKEKRIGGGGTSLPPVLGVGPGPMDAAPPTNAALPCGARGVMSRFEIKILILEIGNCDGREREREKRQHNRCGLGGGSGARHRSALAALADVDLALLRVKLIQMENKRQYI